MNEREKQLKEGEKMVKSAKNWNDYWHGIDYLVGVTGFDTDEEAEELAYKLDRKFGHRLSTK